MKTTLHRYTYLCGAIALGVVASPVFANSTPLAQSNIYQLSTHQPLVQNHTYRQYELSMKKDAITLQAYFVMKDGSRIFGNVLNTDDDSYSVVGYDGLHVFKSAAVKWLWYTVPPKPLPYQGR